MHILYFVHFFLVTLIKNKFLFDDILFSHSLSFDETVVERIQRYSSILGSKVPLSELIFDHHEKKLHLCGHSNETLFLCFKIKYLIPFNFILDSLEWTVWYLRIVLERRALHTVEALVSRHPQKWACKNTEFVYGSWEKWFFWRQSLLELSAYKSVC